jgi:hypothetical protein
MTRTEETRSQRRIKKQISKPPEKFLLNKNPRRFYNWFLSRPHSPLTTLPSRAENKKRQENPASLIRSYNK